MNKVTVRTIPSLIWYKRPPTSRLDFGKWDMPVKGVCGHTINVIAMGLLALSNTAPPYF
jgi:hypothetical protein